MGAVFAVYYGWLRLSLSEIHPAAAIDALIAGTAIKPFQLRALPLWILNVILGDAPSGKPLQADEIKCPLMS